MTLPTTDNYTSNALNQYSAVGVDARVHDVDGNLTDDGVKQYTWDAENRLITVKQGASTIAEYAYDYQSRRISKTVASTVTAFIYDGWNPIAEYESALSPLSFSLLTSFTWGMDLSGKMQGAGGIGGLLAVAEGATTHYPIYDGNGNVSEYVDSTGAVVAHYEYDAFGQAVASGTKANDFSHQFSTKQLDAETGLHYYGFRYYDSNNGRWLGRDPLVRQEFRDVYLYSFYAVSWEFVTIGMLDSSGVYSMLNNSLLASVDVLGLHCCQCPAKSAPNPNAPDSKFKCNKNTVATAVTMWSKSVGCIPDEEGHDCTGLTCQAYAKYTCVKLRNGYYFWKPSSSGKTECALNIA